MSALGTAGTGAVVAVAIAIAMLCWRVFGPLPRVTYRDLWLACPWVDRETGNWSLLRTVCLIVTFSWVHVVETVAHAAGESGRNPFNWPSVSILALIMIGALSKNIGDFTKGAGVVFHRLRRKSDARPVVAEPDGEVHVQQRD